MAASLSALSVDTVSSSVFGDEEGEEDEETEEDPTSSVTGSSTSYVTALSLFFMTPIVIIYLCRT